MRAILTFSFCMFALANFAQLTDAQLNSIQFKVDSAGSYLHQYLLNEGETVFNTTYTVDTFKIERKLSLKLKALSTPTEKVAVINDAEIEYDLLMGKYYKTLLSLYNDNDQKNLVADQKKWIKKRDEQIAATDAQYNKQVDRLEEDASVVKAKKHLGITKKRAIELHKQLLDSPLFQNE